MNIVFQSLAGSSIAFFLGLLILYFFKDILSAYLIKNINNQINKDFASFKNLLEINKIYENFIQNVALSVGIEASDLRDKQVQALESLWESVAFLAKFKSSIQFVSTTNLNELKTSSKEHQDQFLQLLKPKEDLINYLKSDDYFNIEVIRILIPNDIWTLYSSYLLLVSYGVNRILLLDDLNLDELMDETKLKKILELLKPEFDKNNFEISLIPNYLEILEIKLIETMQKTMGINQVEFNKDRALNIIQLTNHLRFELDKKAITG